MYVQRASCNVKDAGDVSITTLIPTQHFHTTYIWITDISSSHPLHHYLVILSPQAAIKYLKLNLIEIGDKGYSWDWVIGTIKWKMVEISLTSKVGSLSAGGFNLGCYLYGLGVNVSYMYAPGFDKGAMPCTETETAAGDEVDNDCDGETDEESNNNFDDDMDGKIDEDLENAGEISGGWGQWMWWSCTNTCASHQARTRQELRGRELKVSGNREALMRRLRQSMIEEEQDPKTYEFEIEPTMMELWNMIQEQGKTNTDIGNSIKEDMKSLKDELKKEMGNQLGSIKSFVTEWHRQFQTTIKK
uniref:SAP domain-containing protein n=1 Tax=Biomphalaria glabrata TaxID=6526 RepID=A0A2C9JKH0_BIOGL